MNSTIHLSIQSRASLDYFLRTSHLYQLGNLPTEQQNSHTLSLSGLSQDNLKEGVRILREVDREALQSLRRCLPQIEAMRSAIQHTLENKGRIFLCGCGATGRLSLSLEYFWRRLTSEQARDQVVAFMAGGDYALIRSIENFEDYPEYGSRQLQDLNFGANDLLISTTEGGETPFVIGATLFAANQSQRKPYFLFCNPPEVLQTINRSQAILADSRIEKIAIETGPMALSGSTRMQASTVLMWAVGVALLPEFRNRSLTEALDLLLESYVEADFGFLPALIEAEATLYQTGQRLHYRTQTVGITLLTDTTERHPTFNIEAFENRLDTTPAGTSKCYLILSGATDAQSAWQAVLLRSPRCVDWPELEGKYGTERLYGFDLSEQMAEWRGQKSPHQNIANFEIEETEAGIHFALGENLHHLNLPQLNLLERHLVLKMLLNIHSCLVMGRLDRYQGNVMTWVKPSNGKLIDRSIRYIQMLLPKNLNFSYAQIAEILFEQIESLQSNQSVVLKTVERCHQLCQK